MKKVVAFLQHGAWQGIGALIGLASLIVTIILTIYIFDFTRNQETAHLEVSGQISPLDDSGKWVINLSISNSGPAEAQGLVITTMSKTRDISIDQTIKHFKGVNIDPYGSHYF